MGANKWTNIVGAVVILGIIVALLTRTPGAEPEQQPTPTPVIQPTAMQSKQYDEPPALMLEEGAMYQAVVNTSKGSFTIELFADQVPTTVNSFVFLANEGFFDGVVFHRIMEGFMIQTGDPTGTGRGGPGYTFADEPFEGEYTRGTVAMANAGPNTNGSQFFIMHEDRALDPNYTIFGRVTEGIEVVDAIAATPVTANMFGEMSTPAEVVQIESVTIQTN